MRNDFFGEKRQYIVDWEKLYTTYINKKKLIKNIKFFFSKKRNFFYIYTSNIM